MDWTQEEIEVLFRLSGSFDHFFGMLDLDPEHPVLKQIDTERTVHVAKKDREIVVAWATWQLAFKFDQTLFWMKRGLRIASPVDEVMAVMVRLGKMAPRVHHRNKGSLVTENGTRLIAAALNPWAGRGMSFNYWIIEGCEPGTKLWDSVMTTNLPIMSHNPDARLIVLEKSY